MKKILKLALVAACGSAVACLPGCGGGDDGGGDELPVATLSTNQQILAEGEATVAGGAGHTTLDFVDAPGDGQLTATVTWIGVTPTGASISLNLPLRSPVTSDCGAATCSVAADVLAGQRCTLTAEHQDSALLRVRYAIVFDREL